MAHVHTSKVIIIRSEGATFVITNNEAGTLIVSWRLVPFCALQMLQKF